MAKSKLYRVSEGSAEPVDGAESAVIPGRYDKNNWGTDWMLFTATSERMALRIAKRYDHALNNRSIRAPRFLKSLSHGWEHKLTGKVAPTKPEVKQ